jgi:hypothetical protein
MFVCNASSQLIINSGCVCEGHVGKLVGDLGGSGSHGHIMKHKLLCPTQSVTKHATLITTVQCFFHNIILYIQ